MEIQIEDLFILLVEPSTTQRKIIQGHFGEIGVSNFKSVETGAEALASIDELKPDLVIAAMHLPDMTSIELVKTMRESEATVDMRFMLISTVTSFEELDPIRQSGATAVLPKPFSCEQLKKALYSNLDQLHPSEMELLNYDIESLNVLIVDDSKMARRQIKRVLGLMGVEKFSEAADGVDAIPKVDNEYFDLIITDYNMPQMDGRSLAEYVRTRSQQPTVPILMVTTEGNQSRLAAAQQSGVSAICDKAFEPASVKNMIEALMAA